MPVFLVEDGSGLVNATSYLDVAFADDYLNVAWSSDVTTKEKALMAATEYFDLRWGDFLFGITYVATQGLEFPRIALYDRYGNPINGIPLDLKKATALYAKEFVGGTLYPTPPAGNAKDVKSKKTVVGPITTEVEYQGTSTSATFLPFPVADKFAKQFASNGGRVIRN